MTCSQRCQQSSSRSVKLELGGVHLDSKWQEMLQFCNSNVKKRLKMKVPSLTGTLHMPMVAATRGVSSDVLILPFVFVYHVLIHNCFTGKFMFR